MLLDKYVEVKWNNANRKHYEAMGYKFTKCGDSFYPLVIDCSKGCNSYVRVLCDYCNEEIILKPLYNYFKDKEKENSKDCCKKCAGKKQKENVINKYGVETTQAIPEVREKSIKTCLEKYGCENPMQNEKIKEKLYNTFEEKYGVRHIFQLDEFKNKATNTMRERYGVDYYTKTDEYKERAKQTCLEKYGVEYFLQTDEIQQMRLGENNVNWKGELRKSNDKRDSIENYHWRRKILIRDNFTCQCCGQTNTKLNVHHIYNYATYENLRFEVSNGVTLCRECHLLFHHLYGYLNTNKYQLDNLISIYGKNIV